MQRHQSYTRLVEIYSTSNNESDRFLHTTEGPAGLTEEQVLDQIFDEIHAEYPTCSIEVEHQQGAGIPLGMRSI